MDPQLDDDPQLLARLASGDRGALQPIYQRHAPVLLGVAVKLLGQRRDAEDVVHDVFVEAWQRAASYDPRLGTVRTWLLLRLRSRCLDRLRTSGRTRSLDQEEPGEGPRREEPQEQPEDPALAPDRALVLRALGALPEAQRAVLELAYFQGLSGSEIALRLGIPLGTVKTRVALGLGHLRDVMKDTKTDPGGSPARTPPGSRSSGARET